jgi:hypothetical protein
MILTERSRDQRRSLGINLSAISPPLRAESLGHRRVPTEDLKEEIRTRLAIFRLLAQTPLAD